MEKQKNTECQLIIKECGVSDKKVAEILLLIKTYEDKLVEISKTPKLKITDPEDKKTVKEARALRLTYKNTRLEAEKYMEARRDIVKEAKAEFDKEDKALLKIKQYFEFKFKEVESELEEIEKFPEEFERKRKEQLRIERLEKLKDVVDNAENFPLGEMSEESFNQMYEGFKMAKEQKEAAEKKAEEERIESERLINLHNERFTKLQPYWEFITDDTKNQRNFGDIEEKEFELYLKDAVDKLQAHNRFIQEQKNLQEIRFNLIKQYSNHGPTVDLLRLNELTEEYFQEVLQKKKNAFSEYTKEQEKKEQERIKQQKELAETQRKLKEQQEANRKAEEERKSREAEENKRAEAERLEKEKLSKAPVKEKLNVIIESFSCDLIEIEDEKGAIVLKDILTKFEGFKKWAKDEIEKL